MQSHLFNTLFSVVFFIFAITACGRENIQQNDKKQDLKVLVFSKTEGFRHNSIKPGIEYLSTSLAQEGTQVVASEDSKIFNDADLSTFSAIIFLNTTGDILNRQQQVAMERYIQAGGGFVGIHSATDTEWEGDWYWYRRLVGGVFAGHPGIPSNVQTARVQVVTKDHPATAHLADNFLIVDEWYDFKSLSDRRTDLLTVDEKSYHGGGHKGYHPIAWYHDFDGGRSFYTGIGHNADNFSKPEYMQHLLGGIEYAIGENIRDYSKSRPEPNRFVKETLLEGLNEPISLDITKDGKGVIFIERKGKVHWFDVERKALKEVGNLPVYSAEGFGEFGLLTVALDPNFAENQHLYMMYNLASPLENQGPLQRISRFTLVNGKLDLSSEIPMLDAENDDTCCHTGGNMEFDGEGNLYIGFGDNTNPFKAFGVGPSDFRAGSEINDALRSSANTQDYRGKILRIKPQPDGSYTIPEGNLFLDSTEGKTEIYVMGTRNPYTLAFDDQENTLYYGDVGPDARAFTDEHGAKGYDEINKVTQAGNFGWPLFIANNKAYRQFDYEADEAGKWHNPLSPQNTSPNNTGAKDLPAAQSAFIYYPYAQSDIFPELAAGGRNALVAGVYRSNKHADALPDYYDGGLFISDFMRRWIKVVFSDVNGDIYKLEEFAPDVELVAPIDLKFSHQGQLYILEYGSKWHTGNPDSRLSRIVYTGAGNRPPLAKMSASPIQGTAPLTVNTSAAESSDPDNDPLQYTWQITSLKSEETLKDADFTQAKKNEGIKASFTLDKIGRYALSLTVRDQQNLSNTRFHLIEVGNTPPSIDISVIGDQSFIWPDKIPAKYQVVITDVEDGHVKQGSTTFENVDITFTKVEKEDKEQTLGHHVSGPIEPGRKESKKRLCAGCHQEQADSVGPAFQKVADRYSVRGDAEAYLKQSITAGSTGKWGQHQMPAHDFLSDDVLNVLVRYVLALQSTTPSLPMHAALPKVTEPGIYQLKAKYTDQGAIGLSAITREKSLTLRAPQIFANTLVSHVGEQNGLRAREADGLPTLAMYGDKTHVLIGKIDLRQVKAITISQKYWWRLNNNVEAELRVGSATGKTIAKGAFNYEGAKQEDVIELTLDVSHANTYEPLYLVVNITDDKKDALAAHLYSFTFISK
ncbi:ThuA domain-containing protein [Paraglaciecola sp.]|uniref:ThuA domain-containing protein n=1 Tax=Paraglaciecola sp. TaxID=1920173 RepID=UPI003267A858